MKQRTPNSVLVLTGRLFTVLMFFVLGVRATSAQTPSCGATVKADVVAFDQIIFYNRLGSFDPGGMIFALRRDVVPIDPAGGISPGNVQLRPDKRPRPIVLRVNEGDCLQVTFTNLLTPNRSDVENLEFANAPGNQPFTGLPAKLSANDTPATRTASVHVNGLDYVGGIASDGAFVGNNASSLAAPGETKVYKLYAAKQGQYLLYSAGAMAGGEGDGGQLVHGLFGSVNVEPRGSKWYRSQVTAATLAAAQTGVNPNDTPTLNFEAAGPDGTPLLNMLSPGGEIVSTDLNAVITGFNEDCAKAPPSSICGQPFREFTVIFHDELETGAPAFAELNDDLFHGVRDGFGINYGSAGLGAELLANRKKVGPAANCNECKYEEFFLESWANGDPAMQVKYDPSTGRAVEALFPDDPSNVHHSYLGDPVRFRNLHAGPKETHIFHLHAHQWLQSPRDENSTYLDSQTISPGASYTYEIQYGGSGNRNVNPGDSIFHCHLYPHFAQGMWELWRNHDVFEAGTPDRNLPDAEIAGGTPNPAIVPLPNRPLPPMPTPVFKGYPFYIAGQAGHRPPQPPLDIENDGGLPRHRVADSTIADGVAAIDPELLTDPVAARVLSRNGDPNLLAFARKLTSAKMDLLPLDGTAEEKTAIKFHEGTLLPGATPVTTPYGWQGAGYPSYTSSGAPGLFLVNGRAPQPGAPYADPCPNGSPLRDYRAAYIQFDMTINSAGWHDRQARIAVLEQDVFPTLDGTRPPEPLFFRANSNDCVVFKSTNLMPSVLNLDDFQVFTPTDIIGQHIHLVKFDVTSSDGAANGWNYEDGTFSPDEVRERIAANNAYQQTLPPSAPKQFLSPKVSSAFGSGPGGAWVGAQTTVQRWWADPLINTQGKDRTIRTAFTHDHFGPSSHQHHGLYAGLVVEPAGSAWKAQDGTALGTRADGGPTTFAANIIPPDQSQSYREFMLEIADFAIVYTAKNEPVNPPNRKEEALPKVIGFDPIPRPESISAADPGTQLINYRNEPIPLRIGEDKGQGQFAQKAGDAGDLANVFSSEVHGDPFTPMLKAYEGDRVQVRVLQGAQEEQHVLNIHGVKWLFEPSAPNSGFTNSQQVGISEHFEFEVAPLVGLSNNSKNKWVDFLYSSAATDNLWDGQWGLMRAFQGLRPGLAPLPNNPNGQLANKLADGVCPKDAPARQFFVGAWMAKDLLPGGALVYNSRFGIADPNAILFVEESDVPALVAGTKKPEPLILRANAGDCISVTLRNMLPKTVPESDSWNFLPPIVSGFNFNQIQTSNRVSLHPQLLSYSPYTDDGSRVGFNPDTTVAPGHSQTYVWYAGDRKLDAKAKLIPAPIEFGALGLRDMGDVIKHSSHGAAGTLIVEPQGSTWTTPSESKATADVKNSAGQILFRDFAVLYQDDLSLQQNGVPMMNIRGGDDSEDSGQKAFNYRTEPVWARLGLPPETDLGTLNSKDHTNTLSSLASNPGCGGACGDPSTPVFTAKAGTPVRFRVVDMAGHPRQHGFTLFGHHWNFEPWTANSTKQGDNPFTFEIGSSSGIGPTRHLNVLTTAGGLFKVPGDYLYRTQESFMFGGGLWGIFRVIP